MRRVSNDDTEFMRRASRDWPKQSGSQKLECPDCGAQGYTMGTWMLAHRQHRRCACGRVMSVRGLRRHQAWCGIHESKEYP